MDILEILLQWIMIIFLQTVPLGTLQDGQSLVYSSIDSRKQLVSMMEITLKEKETNEIRLEGELLLIYFRGLKETQPLKEKIIHRRKVIVEFSVLNRSRVITRFESLGGTDYLHREDGSVLDLVVKGPLKSGEEMFLDRSITPSKMLDEWDDGVSYHRQYSVDSPLVLTGVEITVDMKTGIPSQVYIPLKGLHKLFHDWKLMEY